MLDAATVEAPLALVLGLADGEEDVPAPVPVLPAEPGVVCVPELEPVLVAGPPLVVAVDGRRLAGSETLAQERSYNGEVPRVASLVLLARRPKLGTGVVGAAS
jgi:hypothetical protein